MEVEERWEVRVFCRSNQTNCKYSGVRSKKEAMAKAPSVALVEMTGVRF